MARDRWFISYKHTKRNILGNDAPVCDHNIITDVTPARWVAESYQSLGGERVVTYAEEITLSLAIELSHGGAGVPTAFFNEDV